MRKLGLAAALLAISASGGCVSLGSNPGIADYGNLQQQIKYYYEANAWERGAACVNPEFYGITRADIVQQSEDRLVLQVQYAWRDYGNDNDSWDRFGGNSIGGYCNGFGERQFVLVPREGGGWVVRAMTGEQRGS
jgi:hypothetical protein